jgi:hypothetical protein
MADYLWNTLFVTHYMILTVGCDCFLYTFKQLVFLMETDCIVWGSVTLVEISMVELDRSDI